MWHLWGTGELHTEFLSGKTCGERDHLENLRVDGKIISKMDLQGVGWGDIDWIALSQDKDSRRELLNAVLNLQVP
jgi:hypothetical protein